MSDRTTGATDAQIEAAAKRWQPNASEHDIEHFADCLGLWAEILVPPGYVIVPAAAMTTEAQRAAVGRLVRMESARLAMRVASGKGSAEWGAANDEWFSANNAIQPGDIEAARAVAEGGK